MCALILLQLAYYLWNTHARNCFSRDLVVSQAALILIPVSIVQDSRASRYQSFAAADIAAIVALGEMSEFVTAGCAPRPAWKIISLFVLSTGEYARAPSTDGMGTASWPPLNTMYRGRRLEAQQCRSSGCFPCKSPRMLPMGS
jgi:hypothetical protein